MAGQGRCREKGISICFVYGINESIVILELVVGFMNWLLDEYVYEIVYMFMNRIHRSVEHEAIENRSIIT